MPEDSAEFEAQESLEMTVAKYPAPRIPFDWPRKSAGEKRALLRAIGVYETGKCYYGN